ncbi:MAG: NAD(P)H-dependent oxidoreductase [Eubacteriales bacterium]|nr:NAD(P)H-dependent oxidoreductase [Eubacteriales bacterium]
MNLFINCCPRKESRTRRLADAVLSRLNGYEEVDLYSIELDALDEKKLCQRTALIDKHDYSDPMFDLAKQFASASAIVIAAPFWDLSFPSKLKTYIENIYVTGIVSRYDETGQPQGLCMAEKLYYVTTSGGPLDERFGYGYIRTLAHDYFGIPEVSLIKAEMLDVDGFDPEAILAEAMDKLTH